MHSLIKTPQPQTFGAALAVKNETAQGRRQRFSEVNVACFPICTPQTFSNTNLCRKSSGTCSSMTEMFYTPFSVTLHVQVKCFCLLHKWFDVIKKEKKKLLSCVQVAIAGTFIS